VWETLGLRRVFTLAFTGCLERCEWRNVGMIVMPGHPPRRLERLEAPDDYEALVAWAEASARAGRALPLPPTLRARVADSTGTTTWRTEGS
jgi:hypothetical protein